MPTNARQKLLHTFSIDYASEIDDRRYTGKFTTKKLSIRDLAALGPRKAQLNGGYHHSPDNPGYGIDEQTDEFNSMIAHLELSLVDTPPWWDLDEISDMELIGKVYKEVILHENKFLRRRDAETADSEDTGRVSEGTSEKAENVADSSGGAGEVVVGEVSSSLEP